MLVQTKTLNYFKYETIVDNAILAFDFQQKMVKHYIYVFARSVAVRCILGRGAGCGYVRATMLMQKLTELR